MQISLAKAFKERARLNQKIIGILNLIKEENSLVEGGVRSVDIRKKYQEFHDLSEKMIKLKQAISHANAGIEDKLVELMEVKHLLARVKDIPVMEGKQSEDYSPMNGRIYSSEIKKGEINSEIETLQRRIDALQDEIDEFNARTRIEFEF